MRITITLDDHVATRLERLERNVPLETVVKEALKAGLEALEQTH
jgi:hypothetical protein